MKIRFHIFALCLLAALALLAGSTQADEYTFDYQKIVEAPGPIPFSIELIRGSVTVNGTDDDRIIVEAVKVIHASNRQEAEEVADHIEIKLREEESKISVQTNHLTMLNRSQSFWKKVLGGGSAEHVEVHYTISLPFDCSLAIKSMSADIELSNIEGKIEIENDFGRTYGEFLIGDMTIRQTGGEIDLRWVEGDIRMKSTTSKIFINQVRGAIDLTNHSGNVTIQTELDSPRDYFVETSSGTINFLVPSSASGELKVDTQSGEISSKMPIEIDAIDKRKLVGRFGDGGPRISLSSSTGDVAIALY